MKRHPGKRYLEECLTTRKGTRLLQSFPIIPPTARISTPVTYNCGKDAAGTVLHMCSGTHSLALDAAIGIVLI